MNKESVFQSGKVALVTGAASGIGRAACRIFIERGMSVCMVDCNSENLSRATRDLLVGKPDWQTRIFPLTADVADLQQMNKIKLELMGRFGKLNLLMNNAVTRVGRGLDAELNEWHQAMNTNFWGVVYGVRCLLPVMELSGETGVIVNVGSKQGITNPPGHPIYNITKSALKSYTETLEHHLQSNAEKTDNQRLSLIF